MSFNLIFARSDGYLGGVNLDPDNYDEAFGLFKFATYIDAQLPYFYPNDQGGLSQTYQYDVWKANGQGYDVVGSPYFAIAMDSSILDYWEVYLLSNAIPEDKDTKFFAESRSVQLDQYRCV